MSEAVIDKDIIWAGDKVKATLGSFVTPDWVEVTGGTRGTLMVGGVSLHGTGVKVTERKPAPCFVEVQVELDRGAELYKYGASVWESGPHKGSVYLNVNVGALSVERAREIALTILSITEAIEQEGD